MFSLFLFLFILVVAIQVGYYLGLFAHFSYKKETTILPILSKKPPVSVIIACKNEAENLKNNIPELVAQDYPKFEIVLINDASTDNTLSVIKELANKYSLIQVVKIPKEKAYTGSKKNALTQGINKAKYDTLLFTDADCIPVSQYWISMMIAPLTKDKELVLGYGAYEKQKGWFNKLVRYETLLTAWQYFSYAEIGLPYMGVGRNIAYKKSLFDKVNGFDVHKHVKSGDDDLFVNEVANKKNVEIVWQADSHTLSTPKSSLTDWIKQKRRHITTATSYRSIHQFLLGLFYVSQMLFYIVLIALLFWGNNIKTILLIASIRFVVYYISLIPAANKLKEKDLMWYAPFLELFLIIMQMRIFILNLIEKPKEW